MRVILLGAGASIKADYPPTIELLPAVEDFARRTKQVGILEDWKMWMTFRDSEANVTVKGLLNTRNPEVALSALDLFALAHDDHLRTNFEAAVSSIRDGKPEIYPETSRKIAPFINNEQVLMASQARLGLLRCMNEFFIDKSCEESVHQDKRRYLCDLFKSLREDDVVITLNWDLTAERTLGEMGLWNPATGYGLLKPLTCRIQNANYSSLPNFQDRSQIAVLKLHGSVGWMRSKSSADAIFFDNGSFLNQLCVHLPGKKCKATFDDPAFDQNILYEPALVVPTFLKSVPEGAEMQRIWHLAEQALHRAEVVDIWGYSLPASDSAIRVLLNILRFREQEKEVDLKVHDPSSEARKRWDQFVGSNVSRDERLG